MFLRASINMKCNQVCAGARPHQPNRAKLSFQENQLLLPIQISPLSFVGGSYTLSKSQALLGFWLLWSFSFLSSNLTMENLL